MSRDEIHETILHFFDVIDGEYAPEEREKRLSIALDRLALASHFADYDFDETDYPDSPRKDYDELREIVSPRFPDCGYYNVAHNVTTDIGVESVSVGDAIDDICDIANDLSEVSWRWENNSIDDALWYFRESYIYHWGHHLRDLQVYLLKKVLGQ